MDEKLEKAMQSANYMAALTTQRKLALEEFKQNLIFYHNGASFTTNQLLVSFIKSLVDLGSEEAVVLDDNSIPVHVADLKQFLTDIVEHYTSAANTYARTYNDLKKKRKIEDLTKLL